MPDVKEQVNRVGLALTERQLLFEHVDEYDKPMIRLNFGGGDFSYTHLTINVIFDEDGESAQIVSSAIASVPRQKTEKLLAVLNQCNSEFRWARFYLDEDNDVIADTDVVFGEDGAGFAVVESIMLAASVVDDAYPEIMKGIWG